MRRRTSKNSRQVLGYDFWPLSFGSGGQGGWTPPRCLAVGEINDRLLHARGRRNLSAAGLITGDFPKWGCPEALGAGMTRSKRPGPGIAKAFARKLSVAEIHGRRAIQGVIGQPLGQTNPENENPGQACETKRTSRAYLQVANLTRIMVNIPAAFSSEGTAVPSPARKMHASA